MRTATFIAAVTALLLVASASPAPNTRAEHDAHLVPVPTAMPQPNQFVIRQKKSQVQRNPDGSPLPPYGNVNGSPVPYPTDANGDPTQFPKDKNGHEVDKNGNPVFPRNPNGGGPIVADVDDPNNSGGGGGSSGGAGAGTAGAPGSSTTAAPTSEKSPPSSSSPSPESSPSSSSGSRATSKPKDVDGGGSNTGKIVGGIIGALALLAILAGLLFFGMKRRKRDHYETEPAGTYPEEKASTGVEFAGAPGVTDSDVTGVGANPVGSSDHLRDAGLAAGAVGLASHRDHDSTASPEDPAPHDYVVGVGPTTTGKEFEDIKTRFDQDSDASANLGGHTGAYNRLAPAYAGSGASSPGVRLGGPRGALIGAPPRSPGPRETDIARESNIYSDLREQPGVYSDTPETTRDPYTAQSYDAQERLGADTSGQVTDAIPSGGNSSIAEETAGYPNLASDNARDHHNDL